LSRSELWRPIMARSTKAKSLPGYGGSSPFGHLLHLRMEQVLHCRLRSPALLSRLGRSRLTPSLGVVGMTYGAYHRLRNMPAGVPGVPTASAREDRLHAKGQLRQQPAGDSAEENWSRAMKTKLPNGCLAKSSSAPTGATEAKDGMMPTTTGLSQ
jgi:hypothetical protein